MTRIVLLGYGAMGKELERLSESSGCRVVHRFDEHNPLTPASPTDWDVAIDFTVPGAVLTNAQTVADLGKDLVIGTTGWYNNMHTLKSIQEGGSVGVVWGSNYSVGVQMFFRLLHAAGSLVNHVPSYDVALHETHHTRKRDSPSGTAITAASIILDTVERKQRLETETVQGLIAAEALHVTSARMGHVVGTHTLTLDGPFDTITIEHNARSRAGFAHGALMAARWIHGKKGVFDFTDVFERITEVQP